MKQLVGTLLLGWILFWAPRVAATAQMPDSIMIEGQRHSLTTLPLEGYLEGRKDFPPKEAAVSSANWRGYLAEWKIADGVLYLSDVTITTYETMSYDGHRSSVLSLLFPKQTRIPASWYSGALIVPDGELADYVHMGFGSTYAHYRIYRVSHGRVVESLSLSKAEFEAYRDRKFEAFKKTSTYREQAAKMRKEQGGLPGEMQESFIKSFYAEDYLAQ